MSTIFAVAFVDVGFAGDRIRQQILIAWYNWPPIREGFASVGA